MARHDNMARHCAEIHGRYPSYMKADGVPKDQPYHPDWKQRMLCPEMIWVDKDRCCSLDDQESSESEQDEVIDDNKANDGNSFDAKIDDLVEEKRPEPNFVASSPVHSDSSSHQE